jgi:hypothetical protein
MSQQQPSPGSGKDGEKRMTLAQLRHDIRNYLNAIKLSCALLQRRQSAAAADQLTDESIREIDRSADKINELISRHIGDSETAKNLL